MKWPLPRWTNHRLEQLKAASSALEQDPLTALIAQVKLLGSEGKHSDALGLLQRVQSEYPMETIPPGLFRDLLAAAILAHAPGRAAAWLSQRYRTSYGLSIGVFHSNAPPDVVIMQVHGNAVRFLFGHCLFDAPPNEVLLHRWADIFPMFDAFMGTSHRVDGDVLINLGDGGLRPGLSFSDHHPGYFLIPDPLYMDSERYVRLRDTFRSSNVTWNERLPIALWRGATSGIPPDPAVGWRSLPRIRLCELARTNSGLIDAGITGVVQIADPAARGWLDAEDLMRPHVPPSSFQQYRYQIDIDGNTNSWPGLFMKLLSGSPVLKVASRLGNQQWYYDRLKPWINYVPVDSAIADLVDKVIWLRANDETARKIGEAGRDLADVLTDHREIARAAPVIAAAIRTAAKTPLIDVRFEAGAPVNDVPRTGWLAPEAKGLNAAGFEASLELLKPLGLDSFILTVDVSPAVPESQRLMIVVNGEILLRRSITQRTTVYCALTRAVASARDTLRLGFFFPDSRANASRDNPLDTRMLSVTLHRISVTAASCFTGEEHPDIALALAEVNARRSGTLVHDLWETGQPLPDPTRLQAVRTRHDTLLYADLRTGRVRHGQAGKVPDNLFLVRDGRAARLVRITSGLCFGVRLRPEGSPAIGAGANDFVRTFEIVAVDGSEQPAFGLMGAGLFLSAEQQGTVTLSRDQLGGWEQFFGSTPTLQVGHRQEHP